MGIRVFKKIPSVDEQTFTFENWDYQLFDAFLEVLLYLGTLDTEELIHQNNRRREVDPTLYNLLYDIDMTKDFVFMDFKSMVIPTAKQVQDVLCDQDLAKLHSYLRFRTHYTPSLKVANKIPHNIKRTVYRILSHYINGDPYDWKG